MLEQGGRDRDFLVSDNLTVADLFVFHELSVAFEVVGEEWSGLAALE